MTAVFPRCAVLLPHETRLYYIQDSSFATGPPFDQRYESKIIVYKGWDWQILRNKFYNNTNGVLNAFKEDLVNLVLH